ncbi:MAG: cysteine methyltransferase [Meiothermus sp.]
MPELAAEFRERVLNLIRQIPPGQVMTYGQVALCAGFPGRARHVGFVLGSLLPEVDDVPWQRVINARGRISTYRVGSGELQRALLEHEGVVFDSTGRCDLGRFCWQPEANR